MTTTLALPPSMSSAATAAQPARPDRLTVYFAAFIGLHLPLALLLSFSPKLATLHQLGIFAIGLYFAAWKPNREHVAAVAAYIAGAEVLWRMCNTAGPWEFAKYAISAIFLISMLRMPSVRIPALPVLYMAVLIPSCLFTISDLDLHEARKQISFNLSGPLALAASAVFFSNLRLEPPAFHRFSAALIAPVFGIACVTVYRIATAGAIRFTSGANKVTSGGFGPNQVAAALALGALMAFFLVLYERRHPWLRVIFIGCIGLFAVQSVFTFTRSGVYMTGAGMLAIAFYTMRDRRLRQRLLLLLALLVTAATFVVLPRLDAFTGGKFSERFQDTNLTARDDLAKADLQLFLSHPLYGVGPGMAKYNRGLRRGELPAHTEFTRLLAEHGVFGMIAIIAVFAMPLSRWLAARGIWNLSMRSAFSLWSLLYLAVNAMRLAAPSLFLGFAFVTLLPGRSSER